MTTPSKPLNDQDCIKLENLGDCVSDGKTPEPVTGSPPKKMMGELSEVRRLSTISEQQPDRLVTDPEHPHEPLGGCEWGDSSFSLCSDKFKNSSSNFSSDDSHQPDSGEDCAVLLLSCLYCRFHELMGLLPDTCERAVSRCFPSYEYIMASSERDQQGNDYSNYQLEVDCNFCGSCQDAGELLELAMEISEVCYR